MIVDRSPLITVRNLSLGYGDKVVLDQITFDIPKQGILGLMGPSGVGKTALIRTLSRQNDNFPNFWVRGEALMHDMSLLSCEQALAEQQCPLLAQKSRLYAGTVLDNVVEGVSPGLLRSEADKREWAMRAFNEIELWKQFEPLLHAPVATLSMAKHKLILMARVLAKKPSCLFVDEPTPDIAVVEEEEFCALLEMLGRRIAVVLVTHNKHEAHRLCDTVCLITGGRLIECTPKQEFFAAPRTELGREFLQSGSCWPQASVDHEDAVAVPQPLPPARVMAPMLRYFCWAVPGLLGGMQQAGLLGNAGEDIVALKALGVTTVVNLTERPLYSDELNAAGLQSVHFPIPDMGVPEFQPTVDLCRRISAWMELGRCTVLHCRAGLGRTGTIIACALVYRGEGAIKAIELIRKINPGYIQTDEQFAFVERFAERLGQRLAA